jgi:hypothetical protein
MKERYLTITVVYKKKKKNSDRFGRFDLMH